MDQQQEAPQERPIHQEKPKGKALVRFKRGVLEIFGMFATKKFWWDLVERLAHQAITAFLSACGQTLIFYGEKYRDKEVSTTTTTNNASKAFGGGFTPNSGFTPSTAFPVKDSPGDMRFPGFGPK